MPAVVLLFLPCRIQMYRTPNYSQRPVLSAENRAMKSACPLNLQPSKKTKALSKIKSNIYYVKQ